MIKIPVYKPSLLGNEKKYIEECIDSTWISSKGKFISLFENKFSEFSDIKYSTSVSNGTVALHLALLALGIGHGDEVIVPTLTYIASVNCIKYVGALPVFVDSNIFTWQMDTDDIEKKITSKTKAIIAVHLYGYPCELDRIKKICNKYNIFLIEDCAEALGTTYKNKHVGKYGNIATFSFFGNKTITTGEGGMVVTDNKKLNDRIVRLKGQGLAKNKEYWHNIIGFNYRMTNICAAIGLAQLEYIHDILNQKKNIAYLYLKLLKELDLEFHSPKVFDAKHSYWMCSILTKTKLERDKLRQYLEEKGIETRPVFNPIHKMPMYLTGNIEFKNAVFLSDRGINLPSYPELSEDEIYYICDCIKTFINDYRI
jgi:perosamine synthetase